MENFFLTFILTSSVEACKILHIVRGHCTFKLNNFKNEASRCERHPNMYRQSKTGNNCFAFLTGTYNITTEWRFKWFSGKLIQIVGHHCHIQCWNQLEWFDFDQGSPSIGIRPYQIFCSD